MDMNTLISRASKTLNGYDMRVLEEVDDQMFYDVAREEVIALRLELREPLSEKDVTALSGERGMNLPTDFIEFYDQNYPLRISPSGSDSEGTVLPVISDTSLYE